MLWHLQIEPAAGRADLEGRADRGRGGRPGPARPLADRGQPRVPGRRAARRATTSTRRDGGPGRPGGRDLRDPAERPRRPTEPGTVVHVLPKPGVTDPEGQSAAAILRDLGFAVDGVRTIRTYRVEGRPTPCPA